MRRNDLRALYTRNAAERSVPSKVVSIGLPQASRAEAYRSNLVGARRLRAGRAAALSRTSAGCAKTPGGWPGENGSQKSQKQMVAGRRPLTMGCAVWSVQGLSRRVDTLSSCRRRSLGTSGRNVPVEESPMRTRSPTFCVMMHRPGLEWRACTCEQRIWQSAISFRPRGAQSAMAAQTRAVPVAAAAGRDSPSAMTFDLPGTYTSWFVYSDMNARCLFWRPEVGSETQLRAKIKGL
jgi:hypothetical protein